MTCHKEKESNHSTLLINTSMQETSSESTKCKMSLQILTNIWLGI